MEDKFNGCLLFVLLSFSLFFFIFEVGIGGGAFTISNELYIYGPRESSAKLVNFATGNEYRRIITQPVRTTR